MKGKSPIAPCPPANERAPPARQSRSRTLPARQRRPGGCRESDRAAVADSTPTATHNSDYVNVPGAAGSPRPRQISAAKSARMRAEDRTGQGTSTISAASPMAYRETNDQRSARYSRLRAGGPQCRPRSGGGIRESIHRQTAKRKEKIAPAEAGIQNSRDALVEQPVAQRLRHAVGQDEAGAAGPRSGLRSAAALRGSPAPVPKTMPSARPLRNRQATFHGGGMRPKPTRATSATAMSTAIPAPAGRAAFPRSP